MSRRLAVLVSLALVPAALASCSNGDATKENQKSGQCVTSPGTQPSPELPCVEPSTGPTR
jgi:hypothetical protein